MNSHASYVNSACTSCTWLGSRLLSVSFSLEIIQGVWGEGIGRRHWRGDPFLSNRVRGNAHLSDTKRIDRLPVVLIESRNVLSHAGMSKKKENMIVPFWWFLMFLKWYCVVSFLPQDTNSASCCCFSFCKSTTITCITKWSDAKCVEYFIVHKVTLSVDVRHLDFVFFASMPVEVAYFKQMTKKVFHDLITYFLADLCEFQHWLVRISTGIYKQYSLLNSVLPRWYLASITWVVAAPHLIPRNSHAATSLMRVFACCAGVMWEFTSYFFSWFKRANK